SIVPLQCEQRMGAGCHLEGPEPFSVCIPPFHGRLPLLSWARARLFCYSFSIYHNERDFFAERSAFCYCYSVACCCSNAGRVMGQRLASPPFVSAVFWIIVQVSALN